MLPTRRTQPYRAGGGRMPGMALQAMLTGRQPGQLNPADFNRQRAQNSLQQLVQQRLAPRASADIRGSFGAMPPADGGDLAVDHWGGPVNTIPMRSGDRRARALHDLILQALQAQHRGNGGVAAPPMAHI